MLEFLLRIHGLARQINVCIVSSSTSFFLFMLSMNPSLVLHQWYLALFDSIKYLVIVNFLLWLMGTWSLLFMLSLLVLAFSFLGSLVIDYMITCKLIETILTYAFYLNFYLKNLIELPPIK